MGEGRDFTSQKPFGPEVKKSRSSLNHFTPKSDQVQISPVASPVILHHTV